MAKKATARVEIQYAVESDVQMRNEELGMRNDIAKQRKKPPQRAQRFCNTINYPLHNLRKSAHKKSGRTPVRPPSLSYLLAKILNVSVDTLCHDLSSVFTILNIIDHSVLVFKCLVYREEMTHLIKNVLRQL